MKKSWQSKPRIVDSPLTPLKSNPEKEGREEEEEKR